ncbi:hypothetical protein K523DRAFT_121423 [Schizophyllum commune Tattone D]|nr:hypothetical protein K523DRAFT_121423 [Schizophyllum commune Tattone D]
MRFVGYEAVLERAGIRGPCSAVCKQPSKLFPESEDTDCKRRKTTLRCGEGTNEDGKSTLVHIAFRYLVESSLPQSRAECAVPQPLFRPAHGVFLRSLHNSSAPLLHAPLSSSQNNSTSPSPTSLVHVPAPLLAHQSIALFHLLSSPPHRPHGHAPKEAHSAARMIPARRALSSGTGSESGTPCARSWNCRVRGAYVVDHVVPRRRTRIVARGGDLATYGGGISWPALASRNHEAGSSRTYDFGRWTIVGRYDRAAPPQHQAGVGLRR